MPVGHQLQSMGTHRWACILCRVTWEDLTAFDVAMLLERGDCRGEIERWRPCTQGNRMCLGHGGKCP